MPQIRETVGRLPVYLGDYDPAKVYKKKNRVTMYGSEFQSLIDNNTYAPAELSADETHIIFDEVHWKVISNGTDAFLNHQVVLDKMDEIDSKQASMQSEINGKQLEIGAVQTDLVPTENSSNHMTSGAIYETLTDPASGFVTDSVPEEEGEKLVMEKALAQTYGYYAENPEWIYVIIDSQKHLLGGFKRDGSFEFSKGVPTPIRKYLAQQLEGMVTDISMKVDKEEGKGLVIVDFADGVSNEDNPEWIFVQLDANMKILSGIKNDGTNFISKLEVGEFVNLDRLIANLGNYYNVSKLYAQTETLTYYVAKNGWKQVEYDPGAYLFDETDTYNVGEVCNIAEDLQHSYESIIRQKGYYPAYTQLMIHVTEKLDFTSALAKIPSDVLSSFVAGQVISFINNQDTVEKWELQNDGTWEQLNPCSLEDPENRLSMEIDSDGKILSYRGEDGVKVENAGIKTNHLELEGDAPSDLAKALDEFGYTANNPSDWSESEFVEIPIPEVCAVVNIEVDSQAESKGVDIPTHIQFWDKSGNYFRKPIELNAQGSSSMSYHIKNQAIDFTDGSKIKFGNWPAFDSFHLKKYFIDVFRGQCIVAYWLTEQMYQTRPYGEKRPWDYLNWFSEHNNSNGSFAKDFESGAMAHPDGFPVHIFFNGKDAGIYAFNIKKDRSNYNCKKTNQKQIILDGILGGTFFTANGDLTQPGEDGAAHIWDNFEIRNPKIDKDINGNKYDGDNPKEPSDTFATTKAAIERLTTALSLIAAEQTTEAKKAKFAEFFNIPFIIDYELITQLIYHFDGYRKNWIWCCWDGELWCPTSYDMDSIFGQYWTGASYVSGSTSGILGTEDTIPIGNSYLKTLYATELKGRYKELRDNGIFTVDNVVALLDKWVKGCGYDNLKHDIEDIVTSPYVENGSVVVDGNDNPILVPNTPSYRDDEKTYIYPPQTGGWYNSIQRVKNWLVQRIANLDTYYDYN